VNHWLFFHPGTLFGFFTTGIIPNLSMGGLGEQTSAGKNLVAGVDFGHRGSITKCR